MATRGYLLGHSAREMQRLILQARLLAPITRSFFHAAGIGPGMRVLDVGSGAGDVAILASDLVGTGIDPVQWFSRSLRGSFRVETGVWQERCGLPFC